MEDEKKVPQEEAEAENIESEESAASEAVNENDAEKNESPVDETAQMIADLIKERDANLEMAKRQMADFANYKRRTENARKEAEADAVRDTVAAFLPVLDNLERALSAAENTEGPLKDGVDMVLRQMQKVFEQLHVETINPLGEMFDAESMNAIMQGSEDEGEPGTVCAVLQKGYRIGSKIVRHAMVKVVAG